MIGQFSGYAIAAYAVLLFIIIPRSNNFVPKAKHKGVARGWAQGSRSSSPPPPPPHTTLPPPHKKKNKMLSRTAKNKNEQFLINF